MACSSSSFLVLSFASASLAFSAPATPQIRNEQPVSRAQPGNVPAAVSAQAVYPPIPLTPMEIAELEKRVRQRCGVLDEMSGAHLPWYYHYVLGLELKRAGDDAHALECLKEAVSRRPEPKAGARIYGLWFLDYKPYTALAELNERLGNPECAADARHLAETLEGQPNRAPTSRPE